MNKLFSKTFLWMFIGLLVTFLTGFLVSINSNMVASIFGSWGYIVFIVAELVLVFVLAARIMKVKPTTAKILFLLYSFVSGLTFSAIFIRYDLTSIMFVFAITAGIFGLMAFLGYVTKIDLSRIWFYFIIGIVAIIITSIINIFIGSDTLSFAISIAGTILFIGVTAYDVQKIKQLQDSDLPEDNLAIYGALELYLDFINIFIRLLELFGNKDN